MGVMTNLVEGVIIIARIQLWKTCHISYFGLTMIHHKAILKVCL